MSNLETTAAALPPDLIEKLVLSGDLSQLKPEQKIAYHSGICASIGLNPLTKPFEYMKFQGREVLYATKNCAEQLRKIYRVSVEITKRELIGDVYVVTARARIGDREDESTGAIVVKGLFGDQLANSYMKAETKAKRRVTLSICGLGMLDETEVETFRSPAGSTKAQRIQNALTETPKTETIVEPTQSRTDEMPSFEDFDRATESPDLGDFLITSGKDYKGKKLKEVDPKQFQEYLSGVRDWHEKEGKKLNKGWRDLFDAASIYFAMGDGDGGAE